MINVLYSFERGSELEYNLRSDGLCTQFSDGFVKRSSVMNARNAQLKKVEVSINLTEVV